MVFYTLYWKAVLFMKSFPKFRGRSVKRESTLRYFSKRGQTTITDLLHMTLKEHIGCTQNRKTDTFNTTNYKNE